LYICSLILQQLKNPSVMSKNIDNLKAVVADVVRLAADVKKAAADGKVTIWERLQIAATTAGLLSPDGLEIAKKALDEVRDFSPAELGELTDYLGDMPEFALIAGASAHDTLADLSDLVGHAWAVVAYFVR
jgi:hypothetical protein